MKRHWTLDDIPWDEINRTAVDDDILKVIRAASLVEYNAPDYTEYLCNVFHDDPAFQEAARQWCKEEVQHGIALGEYAKRHDPGFDYAARLSEYRKRVPIPVAACESVRGSRAGELVARCMVEVGTSSFYTALGDATKDLVLKAICRNIAKDEWKHYGLFYGYLKQYLAVENMPRYRRLLVALQRIVETEDDELATAYHVANMPDQPYDRKKASKEYARRACSYYRPGHADTAVAMILKAAGYKPRGLFGRTVSGTVSGVVEWRNHRKWQKPAPEIRALIQATADRARR